MANKVREKSGGNPSHQGNSSEESGGVTSLEGNDASRAATPTSGSSTSPLNATGTDKAAQQKTPTGDSGRTKPLLRSSPDPQLYALPALHIAFPEFSDVVPAHFRKLPDLPAKPQTDDAGTPRRGPVTTTRSSVRALGDIVKQGPPPPQDAPPTTPRSPDRALGDILRQGPPPPQDAPPATPRSPDRALGDIARQRPPPPQDAPPATPRSPDRAIGDIVKRGPPPPQDAPPTTPRSPDRAIGNVAKDGPPPPQDVPAKMPAPPAAPRSSTRPVLLGTSSPGSSKSASSTTADDGLTFEQMLATGPLPVETPSGPGSSKSHAAIRTIAKRIVAAELKDGLKSKTLGRLNPKLDGVSVYNEFGSFANDELAKSDLAAIVSKCRQRVLQKYGDSPEKLISVIGSEADATGQQMTVNTKVLARFLAPVFKFTCGTMQQFGDSRLPGPLLELLKAIDQELVTVLLARRRDQLAAEKLLPLQKRADNADHMLDATQASEARQLLDTELKKLGWPGAYFDTLVKETPFSAKVIRNARSNMFSVLLYTRCVSPFLLYDSEQVLLEASRRTVAPHDVFKHLATCANDMFKADYCEFVNDFIRVSHDALPEESAGTLAQISVGEERLEQAKNSKRRAPGSAGKSEKFLYRTRDLKRSSAPQMAQGKDFQNQMLLEKTSHEAETSTQQNTASPPIRKLRIQAAVDRFKSAYPNAFGDEDFSIAFNKKYRQWLKNNPLVQLSDVPHALEKIFQEVKNGLEEKASREVALKQERRAEQARSQEQGHSASSSRASSSGSTTVSPVKNSPAGLSTDQEGLLQKFFAREERRAMLERYPHLRKEVEAKVIAGLKDNADKNFVFATREIFEATLIENLYRSYLRFEPAPATTLESFKEAVAKWKSDNRGASLTLENVGTILPGAVLVDHVKGTRNWAVRLGELQTETLLQAPEVITKFNGKAALKKEFLHMIREWLLKGAYGQPDENHVQRIYHEVVVEYYVRVAVKIGTDSSDLVDLKDAAMEWCARNDQAFLTTAVLDKLLGDILDRRRADQADS